jgi:alkylhydroperoxidase/carboxymuconolactone decarboxylase family protein YurZ
MRLSVKTWLVLASLGLVFGGSVSPAAAAPPDKLLPEDTQMVFTINVKALLDSAVVKKHALPQIKEQLKGNPQAGEILRALNFDPMKDLTSITIAVANVKVSPPVGGAPQPDANADELMIVRGNFDQARIREALKKEEAKVSVTQHGGLDVYEMKGGDQPAFLALLDNSTLVASTKKPQVTAAIDRSKKGGARLNKEFANVLEKADAKRTIWMAAAIPDNLREMAKGDPQAGALVEKLEGITLGITVEKDITLEIQIHTTDAKSAIQMRAMVEKGKGALTFLAFSIEDMELQQLIADVINTIKTSTKGNAVIIQAQATAEVIDKAVKKLDK